MRMRDIMTKEVETTTPDRLAAEARDRMTTERTHHLVVVDRGEIVGIVSDRDLARRYVEGASVAEVMTSPAVTTDGRCTVREAANLLRGCGIGCLPIVEDGKLAGIVATADLLELLGKGMERPLHDRRRRDLRDRGPAKALKTTPKTKRRADRAGHSKR